MCVVLDCVLLTFVIQVLVRSLFRFFLKGLAVPSVALHTVVGPPLLSWPVALLRRTKDVHKRVQSGSLQTFFLNLAFRMWTVLMPNGLLACIFVGACLVLIVW